MVVTIITMTMIMIKDIYNNTNSDDKGDCNSNNNDDDNYKDIYNNTNSDDKGCHSSSNSSLL